MARRNVRRVVSAWIEPVEARRLFSTYIVTTPGDGAGSVSSAGNDHFNATTLRAAINAANAHSGTDLIRFASSVTGSITLGSALPSIAGNLSIAGPGAAKLTVQRKSTATTDFSIFRILSGKTVAIGGLTIARGTGTLFPDAVGQVGGGIFNQGTLSLNGCTLTANKTFNSFGNGGGGGIYNAGTLTLTACLLSGNVSDSDDYFDDGGHFNTSDGGGIFNDGTATILLSTFSNNSATGGGGGIASYSGPLRVAGCTFNANQGDGGGGLRSASGAIIVNSTFSANFGVYGGAIDNLDAMTATNCTISGNTTDGFGGGIENSGSLTLHNSIVAGNLFNEFSDTPGQPTDIDGDLASASSFNLIGAGGAGGLHTGTNGNRVGVALASLKLGALANNGGKTSTMKLNAGSIAIDAGSNSKSTAARLSADQRGRVRIGNGHVDIGAFETQIPAGSIAGVFFNDLNHDGIRQSSEPRLADMQLYIDANHNSTYDPGEQTTFTDSTGSYIFTDLVAGTYRVRGVQPPGWVRTRPSGVYPAGFYDVTINLGINGGAVTQKDFGSYQT